MVGMSGLNLNNPFVSIMETEYRATRSALIKYTRKTIVTVSLLSFLNILIGIFSSYYIFFAGYLALNVIFILSMMRDTIRKTNLKKVGNIMFGEDFDIYAVNEADVYNTTRLLCEMRGKISGRDDLLNYAVITNSCVLLYFTIHTILRIVGWL